MPQDEVFHLLISCANTAPNPTPEASVSITNPRENWEKLAMEH